MLSRVYLVVLQAGHDANQVGDITCSLNLHDEDDSDMFKALKLAMIEDAATRAGILL